jgi:hypothetical protein
MFRESPSVRYEFLRAGCQPYARASSVLRIPRREGGGARHPNVSQVTRTIDSSGNAEGEEMASGFQFDAKKFERELMKDVRKETQKFFDDFARRYRGKPVGDVKRALSREWKSKMDGTMSDKELTEYATAISEGAKFQVR